MAKQRFLKWGLSAILNFKNFHILSPGCHGVPNLLLCTKLISKSDDFTLRYGDFTIFELAMFEKMQHIWRYGVQRGAPEKLTPCLVELMLRSN